MRNALKLAVVLVAVLSGSTAFAADRCKVTDPTGTPLNVRDADMKVIGVIENGRIVIVERYGEDRRGNPWALIATPDGRRIGWVYREFISCF